MFDGVEFTGGRQSRISKEFWAVEFLYPIDLNETFIVVITDT